MSTILQNIRYALRQLRKTPGFTLTAVITLALGIGANTAIYTLVHGILMQSLPVADPSSIYNVTLKHDGFGGYNPFGTELYESLKTSVPEFEQLTAVGNVDRWSVRRDHNSSEPMYGEVVSGNYFSLFGLGAFAGRVLNDNDDKPAAAPAAVLSYSAWQSEFASDPSIVGSTVYIQSRPFTVVGIAPAGFFGDRISDTPPAFWIPLQMETYVAREKSMNLHTWAWLRVLGRVKPGTSIGALQAKLTGIFNQPGDASQETKNTGGAKPPKMYVELTPGGRGIQDLQHGVDRGLRMLMIVSALVLLIACANIANLMLARAMARRAEISLRIALGAGRGRVIGQILTESVLLSCIGGLAGLLVAYRGTKIILALAFPHAHNMPVNATPSLPVLGFAFLISLVTGILFGIGPAWLSSRAQPIEALRGAASNGGSVREWTALPQKALVVLQVALSFVLLVSAALTSRSLEKMVGKNLGIKTANRYVMSIDPAGAAYTVDRLPGLYRQIEDRFSALPGVASVSLAGYGLGDGWFGGAVRQGGSQSDFQNCAWNRVSPHYLDSLGVPIIRGRNFTEQDTATSPMVAIVSESFAKKLFPDKDPVGQRFSGDLKDTGRFEIIGVFADFQMNHPLDEFTPTYLRPLSQFYKGYPKGLDSMESMSMFANSMVLSFNKPQQDVESLVRKTMAAIDPNLAISDLRSYDAQIADSFSAQRMVARLTSLFGLLALILASVGLYGVMSYLVARRTNEISIRMALGASRSSVVGLVMRDALVQLTIGLVIGVAAALYAGHLMASQLYQLSSHDPVSLTLAACVLTVCAIVASFIPARRAASIEPMNALRAE